MSEQNNNDELLANSQQNLEVYFFKKGRGGRPIVVIKGFVGSKESTKDFARAVKKSCFVGGTIKNGDIIIQGNANVRDKVLSFLERENYCYKQIGG